MKRRKKEPAAARRRRSLASARFLLAACGASACLATSAQAADFIVSNTNDSGPGSLRQAIVNSNTAGGSNTITFSTSGTVTLASELPPITSNVSIAANGATLDGANAYRGLFVYSGTVGIQNLTIQNAAATGGNGGTGNGGGGGGAGLGGALFVAAGASVTIFDVNLINNKAAGGAGGATNIKPGGGGGGGLGGDGGSVGYPPGSGGGGGIGRTANGGPGSTNGSAGIVAGQPGGGAGAEPGAGSGAIAGGGGGGGGYADNAFGAGGGGGIGGGAASATNAGNGGFGGGGGGQLSYLSLQGGGNGGFGGGGGGGGNVGASGTGGFGGGGGGGGENYTGSAGGFGGGTGGSNDPGGGGGGLGAGGAIFVQQGGSLTVAGPLLIDGNTVASGAGAAGGQAGSAFGAGIFLQGNGRVVFSPGIEGQTLSNPIADQTGSGGIGANAGSYQLVVNGPGTLFLETANSYSGGTLVNGATLATASDASLGSISGAVTLMGGTFQPLTSVDTARSVVVGSGSNTIVAGSGLDVSLPLAGSGNLTKLGPGLLRVKESPTFTGNMTVGEGTVALAGADFSGIRLITLTPATTLAVGAPTVAISSLTGSGNVSVGSNALRIGSSTTFDGTFSGNGQISVAAPVALTGVSSFTGTFGVGAGGTLGLVGAGSVASATQVQFEYVGSSTGIFDISRTTAGASVNALSDSIGGGSVDLGSKMLTIAQNSTFMGVMRDGGLGGGTGGQLNVAGATTTLGGINTYTGATTVQGGSRLALTGAGSIAASSQLNLAGALAVFDMSAAAGGRTIQALTGQVGSVVALGGNSLAVGGAGSTIFAGSIVGNGALIKQGAGTLTLTGANAPGGTTVNAGLLVVNGSLSGGVTIGAGGSVGGIGSIAGPFVSSGGLLAPGNSIGTLNVSGSFVQNGGVYQVEVNAGGQADFINVAGTPGTATINGGTVQVLAQQGNYRQTTTYTILTATGGLSGTYSGVTSNFAFLVPSLSYNPNSVFLTLTRSPNAFASGAQTPNQLAVATALDLAAPSATGDFADAHAAMIGLDTQQGPAALNAISGQAYTGFGTVNIQAGQMFLNAVSRQVAGARVGGDNGTRVALVATEESACAGACEAAEPPKWGAWLRGLGGLGTVGGTINAGSLTYSLAGVAVGVDYRLDPRFVAGVAVGYSSGQQWVGGLQGSGWSDSYSAVLYGSFTQSGFYADGVAGYAWSNNRLQRAITIPGLGSRIATGSTGASQFLGQIETGYRIELHEPSQVALTPFARFQAVTASQSPFAESGAGSLSLNVANQNTTSIRTVLGTDLSAKLPFGQQRTLDTSLRLGWAHEYASTSRPMTASFVGAPAIPFTVYGAQPLRDAAVIGFGLGTKINDKISIFARYDGEITGRDDAHAFSAGVRMTW